MVELNLNPKGKSAGDCVIRAIAYATQQSWDKVYMDLCQIGLKMKLMPNDKRVFAKYLESIGWAKQKQPRKSNNTKYTVDEFCKMAPHDVYIVNVAHHLTVVVDGDIVDTWDCGFKTVGNYWIKGD